MRDDEQSVTNSGRLFHARGPATAKARSMNDVLLAPQERMTMQKNKKHEHNNNKKKNKMSSDMGSGHMIKFLQDTAANKPDKPC